MTRKHIFNSQSHKNLRIELRANQTEPEKIFWSLVRKKQLGVKFRRQHGIGRYIVDFYCPDCKLIVEIDGDSHFDESSQAYDAVREEFFSSLGLRTVRFINSDLIQNQEGVVLELAELLNRQTPP